MELILRVGKNGLNSYLQPDIIAKMVVDIALSMYIEQHDRNDFNVIEVKKSSTDTLHGNYILLIARRLQIFQLLLIISQQITS